MVEAATGIPTIIDNDLVAFTEYEHWFGAGRGLDRFAVVTLGAGVGYGLVIHDEIVRSDEFGIGLIGHWPLDPFGPVCSEGHRGCAKAILDRYGDRAIGVAGAGQARDLQRGARPRRVGRTGGATASSTMRGRGLGRAARGDRQSHHARDGGARRRRRRLSSVAAEAVGGGPPRRPRSAYKRLPLTIRSGDNIEWCRGAAVRRHPDLRARASQRRHPDHRTMTDTPLVAERHRVPDLSAQLADSNGDGMGDIIGIIGKLDYLQRTGHRRDLAVADLRLADARQWLRHLRLSGDRAGCSARSRISTG